MNITVAASVLFESLLDVFETFAQFMSSRWVVGAMFGGVVLSLWWGLFYGDDE